MYDTMQKVFFRPHMANDVYKTVRGCEPCEHSRKTEAQTKSAASHNFGTLQIHRGG